MTPIDELHPGPLCGLAPCLGARRHERLVVLAPHGENWDAEMDGFGPVRRLADGEPWVLP